MAVPRGLLWDILCSSNRVTVSVYIVRVLSSIDQVFFIRTSRCNKVEASPGILAKDCQGAIALLHLQLARRLSGAGAMVAVLDSVVSEAALGICDTLSAPVI